MKITLEIDPLKIHIFLKKVKEITGFLGISVPNTKELSANETEIWTKIKLSLDEIKQIEQGKKIGKPLAELKEEA